MSTHYEILGIEPNASLAEIRRRYRELARRLHPDVSRSPLTSHQEFIRVTEAYHVLADPVRRADYDHEVGVRRQEMGVGSWELGVGVGGSFPNSQLLSPHSPPLTPDPWLLTPGAQRLRVDVDFGGTVLVCRLREGSRGKGAGCTVEAPVSFTLPPTPYTLTLAAPRAAWRDGLIREGARVKLTLYLPAGCFEAETSVTEWIWNRPPLLVAGPVEQWRASPRRRSRRLTREVEAQLELESVGAFAARTANVSATGLLLLLRGCPEVWEGAAGRLSLQIGPDLRCGPLPCRVARVLRWLRPSGRSVEVGVHLLPCDGDEETRWQQCLARLGVEE